MRLSRQSKHHRFVLGDDRGVARDGTSFLAPGSDSCQTVWNERNRSKTKVITDLVGKVEIVTERRFKDGVKTG